MERLRGQVRPRGGRCTWTVSGERWGTRSVTSRRGHAETDYTSELTGLTRIHTASRSCSRGGTAMRTDNCVSRRISFFLPATSNHFRVRFRNLFLCLYLKDFSRIFSAFNINEIRNILTLRNNFLFETFFINEIKKEKERGRCKSKINSRDDAKILYLTEVISMILCQLSYFLSHSNDTA